MGRSYRPVQGAGDGTLQRVLRNRLPLLLAGLAIAVCAPAPAAFAQTQEEMKQLLDSQADALMQRDDVGGDTMDPSDPGGAVVGGEPSDDPAGDFAIDPDFDLSPEEPADVPEVAATAGPPVPPPYYMPGPGAATNPVASVTQLTDPEVPLEPLRLGALALVVLLLGGISFAALSRALGWREPLGSPVATRRSRARRLADSMVLVADDMRDFVRRRR